ncbi:MAG: hypothetical protein M1832_002865 [Thelocarpon impressellum]|nr:MAG: hypothetical protein M1832_002865 [Thelocarpon impressellum]
MDSVSLILVLILTIIFPPIGVAMVAGCGPDLLINICLTILGYFPGHIHAFYVIYIYHERREALRRGVVSEPRAPGIYSERVQSGGQSYGTVTRM